MKIDETNALSIASIGVGLAWLIFGIPILRDLYSDTPSQKHLVVAVAVLFGGFIGTAFYLCLACPLFKAMRKRIRIRPVQTLAFALWIGHPLVPLSVSVYWICMKIFGND